MFDKTVWSKDDESFNSDSLGDLIRDYDLVSGDKVYKGDAYQPSPSMFVDADDVIELAQERACDEFSDYADDFLDRVSDEEKEKLDSYISEWMKRNAEVRFYSVRNVTEHVITDEDVSKALR